MSKMLQYHPQHRISAIEALCHPFFDPLRDPAAQLPNGHALPPLFNFSKRGMWIIRMCTPWHVLAKSSFLVHRIVYSTRSDTSTRASSYWTRTPGSRDWRPSFWTFTSWSIQDTTFVCLKGEDSEIKMDGWIVYERRRGGWGWKAGAPRPYTHTHTHTNCIEYLIDIYPFLCCKLLSVHPHEGDCGTSAWRKTQVACACATRISYFLPFGL